MEWCAGTRFNWLDATRRRVIGDIMIHSVNIKSAKYIAEKVTPFGGKEQTVNVSVHVIDKNNISHYVPTSESNTDYLTLLEWVKDGNTIEDAD